MKTSPTRIRERRRILAAIERLTARFRRLPVACLKCGGTNPHEMCAKDRTGDGMHRWPEMVKESK